MQLKKSSKIAMAAASLLGAAHVTTASAAASSYDEPAISHGKSDYPVQDKIVEMSSLWNEFIVENSNGSSTSVYIPKAAAPKSAAPKSYARKAAAPKSYKRKAPKVSSAKDSEPADWSHEASLLYYLEGDNRVEDKSFKYKAQLTTKDDNTLSLRVGMDSLTGASPSGGAPLTVAQTVTSPSGTYTTVTPDNELVLDYGFQDQRVDVGATWDQGIDDETRVNVGVSASKENEYLHTGVSAGLSRVFNDKDTTVSLGVAYANDTIDTAFDIAPGFSDVSTKEGADEELKETVDLVVGISQIVSKDTIVQLNYGVSKASGYLNDPYKQISRVNSQGTEVVQSLKESRPDERLGHNLFAAVRHNISGDVLNTSARLHTDDFGIDSFTLDAKYKIKIDKKSSIEPHVRYYTQTAADFYTPQLDADEALPEFASSDYRLAKFDSYSIGATYRLTTEDEKEWRLTTELYSQNPAEVERTEGQKDLNSNPGFYGLIASVGVKF